MFFGDALMKTASNPLASHKLHPSTRLVWGLVSPKWGQVFAEFQAYFPELAKLVVFRELATPLSTVAVTGHRKGAFYGLDVTPDRMLSDALRMKTPVKGFYLSGQDAATPGIPGAMWGGVLCAGSIDPKVFKYIR